MLINNSNFLYLKKRISSFYFIFINKTKSIEKVKRKNKEKNKGGERTNEKFAIISVIFILYYYLSCFLKTVTDLCTFQIIE